MDGFMRRRALMSVSATDPKLIYEAHNIILTGSNFVDTGFKPYSSENHDRDFMITIRYSQIEPVSEKTAIICGAKHEGTLSGVGYPGFYYRFLGSSAQWKTHIQLALSGSNAYNFTKPATTYENVNFYIRRVGGVFSVQMDGDTEHVLNVATVPVFDNSVLIGAGVQTNGNHFRYTKGTIDYFRIEYL